MNKLKETLEEFLVRKVDDWDIETLVDFATYNEQERVKGLSTEELLQEITEFYSLDSLKRFAKDNNIEIDTLLAKRQFDKDIEEILK